MPRFFVDLPLSAGFQLDLPEAVVRHVQVLRLREGDTLTLFNGSGGEYPASLQQHGKKSATALLGEHAAISRESSLVLTLVQAVSSGDRMDYTLQKAVELGVSRIVPVASQRSVVRLDGERAQRRLEHWRGVVASACEQCGRNRVPEVSPLSALDRWLSQPANTGALRLMLAPGAAQTLGDLAIPAPGSEVELLIGAEGGLAPEEVALAASAGYLGVRLGPRILRTETAGLAALAAIQCLWGDFGKGVGHV